MEVLDDNISVKPSKYHFAIASIIFSLAYIFLLVNDFENIRYQSTLQLFGDKGPFEIINLPRSISLFCSMFFAIVSILKKETWGKVKVLAIFWSILALVAAVGVRFYFS